MGADPDTLIMIFKSLVKSRLEYGGLLILPCEESHFNILQKIQNASFKYAMGYQNTTPIRAIHAETKVLYLKHRFEILTY